MRDALDQQELRAINQVNTLLLSPFAFDSFDGWRHAVNASVRELLGADSVGFLLPGPVGQPMYSAEHPAENMAAFPGLVPPDLSDGTPIWVVGLRMQVASMSTAYGPDLPRYLSSAYYNEFAAPNGAAYTASLIAPLESIRAASDLAPMPTSPLGVTALQVWRERAGSEFDERALALLSLLAPAFESGVDAVLRMGALQREMVRTIDDHDLAVLLVGPDGLVRHRSRSLDALLAREPLSDMLWEQIRQFAIRAVGSPLMQGWGAPSHTIHAALGAYHLRLSRMARHEWSGPLTLISVDPPRARMRSDAELRSAFGLTEAEVRVARAVGRGSTNPEMAEQFGVSVHTIRRQVESVFRKLGVSARAAVAARLVESAAR